jgi:hypothetical protein
MHYENNSDMVALAFYILMLVILALFCIWGMIIRIVERRERRSRDLHSRTGTVTKIVLNRFPTRNIESDVSGSDKCVICYQEYEAGEVIRELPCNHFFHKKVTFVIMQVY